MLSFISGQYKIESPILACSKEVSKDNMVEFEYIIPFAIALIVSFFACPIAKKIAVRLNAIDVPKDDRRMHKKPIALMGGLAVITGFLVSILYIFLIYRPVSLELWLKNEVSPAKIAGFFAGMAIIIAMGIVDDIHPLTAKAKFPIQLVAAAIVVFTGTKIKYFTISVKDIKYISINDIVSVVLSILWIVGITNAINLIDGLDGLSAGVTGIASLSLFVVAVMVPTIPDVFAVLYVALAGAAMGFLPYNFNPAKIFIGSTGAYFLGFVLSVISIEGATKAYTALTMVVSLIALGLPIIDTAFAIIRRVINRKPIGEADRGHIHHRLVDMGISPKYSVTILYVVTGALGLVSILLADKGLLPAIVLVVIISVFVVGGARYLSGIIGSRQEEKLTEDASKENPSDEDNVENVGYPQGETKKS